MRLALVAPGFHAYAGDPFAPFWAEAVAGLAARHEVTVYPLRLPAGRHPYALYGAVVQPLGFGHVPLRRSPALWAAAVRAIAAGHRRAPFDLIYALHGNEAGFVAALAGARLGLPLGVHLGGGELTWLADIGYGSRGLPWERAQVALALARARRVTVGSHAQARAARAALGGRAWRVAWAPFGVDTARFRPGPPAARPRLLHVGDLNPVKGQAQLLAAFARLRAEVDGVRLDIVGGGPRLAGLRRLSRDLGLGEALRWWGRVPHAAMPLAYAGAWAFAGASWHEGQGLALAEAASCGLPIAATAVGLAPDLPAAGTRLVAPGDVAGLAEALLAALETGPARAAAAAALRAHAVRELDLAVAARRLGAVLAAAAEER